MKIVKFKHVRRGKVRVNEVCIYKRSKDIVCLLVDLHSKYADCFQVEPNRKGIQISFAATERTIHVDEKHTRIYTTISLPEFGAGWSLFGGSEIAKYTLLITLIRSRNAV